MVTEKRLTIIGSTEYVEIFGVKDIPAKIDTGADSSAIWASDIEMEKDGTLVFCLFDKKSPFYSGERIRTREYVVKSVRSSHGDTQVRYRVKLPLMISGRAFTATFTLASRARNRFPVLIGKRALEGNFLVDVSVSKVPKERSSLSHRLNNELRENPYKFHQKYIKKGAK